MGSAGRVEASTAIASAFARALLGSVAAVALVPPALAADLDPGPGDKARIVCCDADGDVLVVGNGGGLEVSPESGFGRVYRGYGNLKGWYVHVEPWTFGTRKVSGVHAGEQFVCTTSRWGGTSCRR